MLKAYQKVKAELNAKVKLIVVTKTISAEQIQILYNAGHRDFGENRVEVLTEKYKRLPKDIRWHFIGHLQRKKVKKLLPMPELIHSVDRLELLDEINKRALQDQRIQNVLLQIHVAQESSKHGFSLQDFEEKCQEIQSAKYSNIQIKGLMAMASFCEDQNQIKNEFLEVQNMFLKVKPYFSEAFCALSMGMSSDYHIAIQCGSTMVRVGSTIVRQF